MIGTHDRLVTLSAPLQATIDAMVYLSIIQNSWRGGRLHGAARVLCREVKARPPIPPTPISQNPVFMRPPAHDHQTISILFGGKLGSPGGFSARSTNRASVAESPLPKRSVYPR